MSWVCSLVQIWVYYHSPERLIAKNNYFPNGNGNFRGYIIEKLYFLRLLIIILQTTECLFPLRNSTLKVNGNAKYAINDVVLIYSLFP